MIYPTGDRSLALRSMRNGSQLSTDLERLSTNLSTGRPESLSDHLSGRTARVLGLDRELKKIDDLLSLNENLLFILKQKQHILSSVGDTLESVGARLLSTGSGGAGSQVAANAKVSRESFDDIIGKMNSYLSGRALFGGAKTNVNPLMSPEEIVRELKKIVAGGRDPENIEKIVRDWFFDDINGFGEFAYMGSNGVENTQRIGGSDQNIHSIRADDPAVRETLASLSIGIVAGWSGLNVDETTRSDLMQRAGELMLSSRNSLIDASARIGTSEEKIEVENDTLQAKRASLAEAQNDWTRLDPFRTASELQDVQRILELHYAAIAKASRLSLVNFL